MTFTFSAISTLFLLIKVIKNLSKVFMQQYNYPKLIWMKQTVSFACSNYWSNWQLTDNFCLHLSEPNRIETRRKRIVNRIVTTEPRCTVISVNLFTSTQNLMQSFPRPSDATHKILSRSAKWLQRYSSSKVWNFCHPRASNSKMSGLVRPKIEFDRAFYACPGYQQRWWWFDQKWTS